MLDFEFPVHYGRYLVEAQENGRAALGGLDASVISDRLPKDQLEDASCSHALIIFEGAK